MRGDRFSMMPLKVMADPGVVKLTHATFRVLVTLAGQYNGGNNGALGLTQKQAAARNISNKTLYKALARLEKIDIICITRRASRVPPRPAMFSLTWVSLDNTEYSQETRTPARLFRGNELL